MESEADNLTLESSVGTSDGMFGYKRSDAQAFHELFYRLQTAMIQHPLMTANLPSQCPIWFLPQQTAPHQFQPYWFPSPNLTSPDFRSNMAMKDNTVSLKLWLVQHRKHPYPTKPEKIMLAILSRMTLTQVSTWFANARRRLKKDYPDVYREQPDEYPGCHSIDARSYCPGESSV